MPFRFLWFDLQLADESSRCKRNSQKFVLKYKVPSGTRDWLGWAGVV